MINQQNLILLIVAILILQAGAQDSVPLRSDISYEVSADSLLRNNSPQDLNLSITCESSEEIETYILRLSETEILWTVVSAEFNGQPLWLILNEGKANRDDILAWQYDQEENVLRLYPPTGSTTYEMNMVLRVNLLRSGNIKKLSEKEIALEAQSGGILSRCEIKGVGNKVTFK